MGYNTRFTGTLKFTTELTVPMLKRLNEFFGEDPREHPEWDLGRDSGYIDLKLAPDYSGIQWDDGCEKTYFLEKSVALIIREMRKEWPQFSLTGSLLAQGEDVEDRWELLVDGTGGVRKKKLPIPGTKVECPHCHRKFYHEGSASNGKGNADG